MDKEEAGTEPLKLRWAIALDWFQQSNRSITALIRDYLCPKCAKRLGTEAKDYSPDTLISTIKDCCSHTPGFISDRLSIIESVFRLFLSNGNQPLAVEEIGVKLGELRGGDPYRTSSETLLRILNKDHYYGLQEIQS